MSKKIETDLARVKGLGAAHEGVHHWWMQRVTALALVPLCIWFLYSLMSMLTDTSVTSVAIWLAEPIPALLMLLFIGASFYHANLGIQVIIEDYVHSKSLKTILLLAVKLGLFTLAVMALLAVLKLHFLDFSSSSG